MTEKHSRNLTTDELFDLLMKSTKELVALTPIENTEEYLAKKKEVELLQRIIVEKRAKEKPGPPL